MQTISFPANAAASPVHHGVRELLENALEKALLIANSNGEVLFATRKKKHAANLYAKLGVPTRTSAARCALSILLADA
jgi:ATP/maltotriose-dependent transcriptional regulator MalT